MVKKWTTLELNFLKTEYFDGKQSDLEKHLDKDWRQIKRRAFKLKLKRQRNLDRTNTWSQEEIEILKKEYPSGSRENIESLFPSRDWEHIKRKAQLLKIKRIDREIGDRLDWTPKETEFLLINHNEAQDYLLENLPKRNWKSIRKKLNDLGLTREKYWGASQWLLEDIDYLKKEYPFGDIEKIVSHLNRSWVAIMAQAQLLGIKKDYEPFWTEDEIQYLKDNYSSAPREELLKNLPRHTWKAIGIKSSSLSLTRNKNIILEKTKKTNLARYGVANTFQSEEIKEKIKQTNFVRYGVANPNQCKKIKEKIKEKVVETQKKIYETKKKNGTFNTSKPEVDILEFLKEHFPDIKYQYKSGKYPFNCDYYIPSLDLYIEFQGSWTHGKEPFNGSNLDPKWEKGASEGSKYYKNAIRVYTEKDPNKREVASKNNLNYLEIWYEDYARGLDYLLQKIDKLP